MSTFHIGHKIDTNIQVQELTYQITIYDTVKKQYIKYMDRSEVLPASKEIYKIFNSTLTKEQAQKHIVWLYLYRSWRSSTPTIIAYCQIGTLQYFSERQNYQKLPPLKVRESKATSSPVKPHTPPETSILNISRSQIFVTPEYPAGNSKDPFRNAKIEKELQERLKGATYPHQEGTSLCGPAAYFYCLLKESPDLYKTAIKQLWENGKTQIGALEIKAGNAAKPKGFFHPNTDPKMLGIDWITMASLRDSDNAVLSYSNLEEQVSAITTPQSLYKWLQKSGAQGIQNLTTLLRSSSLAELVKMNEYVKKGYRVVQLINSPNILGGKNGFNWKTHWIVWEGPVVNASNGVAININSKSTDIIDLKMFTWGRVRNLRQYNKGKTDGVTLGKFLNGSFGAIVFDKI